MELRQTTVRIKGNYQPVTILPPMKQSSRARLTSAHFFCATEKQQILQQPVAKSLETRPDSALLHCKGGRLPDL